jgi:hypothetical protein
MDGSQRIRGEYREYISMEVLNVEQGASPEDRSCKVGCSEGHSELFLGENQSEVVRVDASVGLIPLFGVDVPASSEGIRLCAKLSGVETNDHIELGEELQPAGLLPSQEFSSCKVLQVFVVGDHINRSSRAFEVVTPSPKRLVNGEQFFVMGVIVELWSGQSLGEVGDWPDLFVGAMERENASNGIIRGIGLQYHRSVRRPMSEDRRGGESILERAESRVTGFTEVPRSTLASESSQRSDYVGIIINEAAVEICKTEEGLNVLDFMRLGPVLYGL